jgi:hypothetical protein
MPGYRELIGGWAASEDVDTDLVTRLGYRIFLNELEGEPEVIERDPSDLHIIYRVTASGKSWWPVGGHGGFSTNGETLALAAVERAKEAMKSFQRIGPGFADELRHSVAYGMICAQVIAATDLNDLKVIVAHLREFFDGPKSMGKGVRRDGN